MNWETYREGDLAILRNELQKILSRLSYQAERTEKERTRMADFLADVSHQLRTPLPSMNLLLSSDEPNAAQLHALRDQLRRMDWLVDSLLKMARLDSGSVKLHRQMTPLEPIIRVAANGIAVPMELREQVLNVYAEPGVSFVGDSAWTAEALGNILKNCMEHTPRGGTVSVCLSGNPLYAEIRITDTGKGIGKEDLPHIFERFYRGENASLQSFGIGLALARQIIAAQNGTIKAENLPAGGACFTVKFYKEIV